MLTLHKNHQLFYLCRKLCYCFATLLLCHHRAEHPMLQSKHDNLLHQATFLDCGEGHSSSLDGSIGAHVWRMCRYYYYCCYYCQTHIIIFIRGNIIIVVRMWLLLLLLLLSSSSSCNETNRLCYLRYYYYVMKHIDYIVHVMIVSIVVRRNRVIRLEMQQTHRESLAFMIQIVVIIILFSMWLMQSMGCIAWS